jgi:hypothetical protein
MAQDIYSNTHDTGKFISSIVLPGSTEAYEIHDAKAIHDIADLGLSAALVFKGTKNTPAELPDSGNKVGDVWLVLEDIDGEDGTRYTNKEFVWTEAGKWEMLGNVHDAASSTHIHTGSVTVAGTNKESAVTGTVTIPTISVSSEDRAGTVSGGVLSKETGKAITSVSVASVTHAETKKHIKGTAAGGTVKTTSKDVLSGVTPTPGTFLNKAEQTAATVISAVTPEKANAMTGIETEAASAITGFGTHTTAKAITGLKTGIVKSTVATDKKFNGITDTGTASTFKFEVGADGILTISGANSVAPTMAEVQASELVTTSDATVATGEASGTADAITELGAVSRADAITKITPATAAFVNGIVTGEETVVGKLETDSGSAITAITPATISVLDSATIDKQPTITLEALENAEAGTVHLVDGLGEAKVTLSTETGDFINTASVSPVTVTTPVTTVSTGTTGATVTGTAAAQEWTMTPGSGSLTTGQPQG